MSRYGRFLPLLLMILVVLTGCSESPSALNPVGKNAEMEAWIMLLSLGVMLFVIVVVMIIFFYVIIRFRKRKNDDSIPEQVEGNHKLEITWTVIPIILLVIIAIPMVYQIFELADDTPKAEAEGKENAITVNVTAHQYYWEFEYPDQKVITASDLYVPTGTKVYVNLTSEDVIHSFWSAPLFGKQDVNPGLKNEMWFKVDETGVYNGQCAELCGPSHALMDFKVIAVSPDKFEKWVKAMNEGEDKPTSATAKQGRKIFKQQCMRCHAIGTTVGSKALPYPNLTGFGDRTTIAGILEYNEKNLKAWIHDAPSLKADI
ncbi:MAG TPA: cytochrome c oxidase subunit II, partial [Bacillales bacterium]